MYVQVITRGWLRVRAWSQDVCVCVCVCVSSPLSLRLLPCRCRAFHPRSSHLRPDQQAKYSEIVRPRKTAAIREMNKTAEYQDAERVAR
jgi:hypothetical protein